MKKLYIVLVVSFILSIICGIVVAYEYFQFVMKLVINNPEFQELASQGDAIDPAMIQEQVKDLFSPAFITSITIASIAGLVNP